MYIIQQSAARSQERAQDKQKGNLELVDEQCVQVFQCISSRCWLGQERNKRYTIFVQDD